MAAVDRLREGCRQLAGRARHVTVREDAIGTYAASLPAEDPGDAAGPDQPAAVEQRAAFWLTLDAINFGSGWFPTLRKAPGSSGYGTISGAWRARFTPGVEPTAAELSEITPAEVGAMLGQDHAHPLMAQFAESLRDLGRRIDDGYGGSFSALARSTDGSAVALAERLGSWPCFADTATLDELVLPFRKRAQIAAADLARAGVLVATDLQRLTMFADNLVPHVLRVDGLLAYAPELLRRIDAGELLEHGSREEIEIRACAVHAVELIVAARRDTYAAAVDAVLWNRGQGARYKALPRHRSRCRAY